MSVLPKFSLRCSFRPHDGAKWRYFRRLRYFQRLGALPWRGRLISLALDDISDAILMSMRAATPPPPQQASASSPYDIFSHYFNMMRDEKADFRWHIWYIRKCQPAIPLRPTTAAGLRPQQRCWFRWRSGDISLIEVSISLKMQSQLGVFRLLWALELHYECLRRGFMRNFDSITREQCWESSITASFRAMDTDLSCHAVPPAKCLAQPLPRYIQRCLMNIYI